MSTSHFPPVLAVQKTKFAIQLQTQTCVLIRTVPYAAILMNAVSAQLIIAQVFVMLAVEAAQALVSMIVLLVLQDTLCIQMFVYRSALI